MCMSRFEVEGDLAYLDWQGQPIPLGARPGDRVDFSLLAVHDHLLHFVPAAPIQIE